MRHQLIWINRFDRIRWGFARNREPIRVKMITYSYQCNSEESMLTLNTPKIEEINIAPGGEKQPYLLLTDENCEPLVFPYLFATGKFGYKVQ